VILLNTDNLGVLISDFKYPECKTGRKMTELI